MNLIILLAIILMILYGIRIMQFRKGWLNYPQFKTGLIREPVPVSVVVAFRNEAENIRGLLESLGKQHYPPDKMEVILVDDHSNDGSDTMAVKFCKENPVFKYHSSRGRLPGKKAALKTGIAAAANEILVTTDADCRMSENWLSEMTSFIYASQADFVIGLVDMKVEKGFFHGYQETEFMSLIASGAGAATRDRPVYCNGANMAFRKSLFTGHSDPFLERIASGDDTLLLHTLKKNNKRIRLLKSLDSIVYTKGESSISGYINQRIRWVSKSRYYHDRDTITLALLVLSVNISIITSLLYFAFTGSAGQFLFLYSAKLLFDFLFLKSFLKYFGKDLSSLRFAVYSAIYPFAVFVLACMGFIWGFKWKDRSYKK